MILATHQPIFLPWPGFFHKAMHSDCMVLLDDVQFPRGRSWLNRNRLKNNNGEMWLTVPVWKKSRGLQVIRDVEIYDRLNWRKKHLFSIQQHYAHAPYYRDYYDAVESVYREEHPLLADFNIELIRFLWEALLLDRRPVLQSDLGTTGKGTELLVNLCKHVGADRLAVFPHVDKHLDVADLKRHGISLFHLDFHPPVYPQLWRDFIYNLSTLDLLLNCGPKARDVIAGK